MSHVVRKWAFRHANSPSDLGPHWSQKRVYTCTALKGLMLCLDRINNNYRTGLVTALYPHTNVDSTGQEIQASGPHSKIYELRREKMGLRIYANSKASDEPARMRMLAWSFAVCICSKAHFLTTWLLYFSNVYSIYVTGNSCNQWFREISKQLREFVYSLWPP